MEDERIGRLKESWSDNVLRFAAQDGQLRVLEWAYQNRLAKVRSLRRQLFYSAAGDGRIDVLEWLYAKGLKADADICSYAVTCGQLEALKWLLGRGCPLDNRRTERHAFADAFGADEHAREVERMRRRLADMEADERVGDCTVTPEKKLTAVIPDVSVRSEEDKMFSNVKVVSIGPEVHVCKECEGVWETWEEVITHCQEVHGYPPHMARSYVESKRVPVCKKAGCFCGASLGPGKQRFLGKADSAHLVTHLVYSHKVLPKRAEQSVREAFTDDKEDRLSAIEAALGINERECVFQG
jgi:hypothetical protein